jgi:type IV pilus assembly protein PilW
MARPVSVTHRTFVSQHGLTLVELMVSIVISLMVMTAMASLYANVSSGRAEIERVSRRMENGRYGLNVLADEIQNAGYFAEFDPRALALPTTNPDPCATTVADLGTALRVSVQGYDNADGSALACLTDVKAGSDIIVLRRLNGCANGSSGCTALVGGEVGFQASSCSDAAELGSGNVSNFFKLSATTNAFTLRQRNCTSAAEVRKLFVRIFYIANNDKAGDGIPTLKKAELSGSGFVESSVAQGVDSLQIEYGLDTAGNGVPTVYTANPDAYLACNASTTPTCVGHWASVVTAKIHMLARSVDASPGFSDSKTYTLGRAADGTGGISGSQVTVGPYSDAFKRTVFQSVVRFQNPALRSLSSAP